MGISRQGGNYFHSQKQGLGSVITQGDRFGEVPLAAFGSGDGVGKE